MSTDNKKAAVSVLPDVTLVSENTKKPSDISETSDAESGSSKYETISTLSPESSQDRFDADSSSSISKRTCDNNPTVATTDSSNLSPGDKLTLTSEDSTSPEMSQATGGTGASADYEITEEDSSAMPVMGSEDALATDSREGSGGEHANRRCCPDHRSLMGCFRFSMMYLRESVYIIPFQLLLLSLPVSSGFMGAKNMEKCPASPAIPLLMFMMGILGTIILCSRIYAIFKMALFPQSNWSEQIRSGLVSAVAMVGILYASELACFFTASPSFIHEADNYCDESFYTFTYYANYTSFAVVIALLLLHCPGTHPSSVPPYDAYN